MLISFTLRTKLLIIVAVPMLLLGSIAAFAALQAKSLGDNAAEQVESVDQALAIERLADALRAELASTLDPGGTPEGLEVARSATNTRWVKVFAFMNEADRATLDLNQEELLRIREGFGDDPAAVQELLSTEILAQVPEGSLALLGTQGFNALITETVRLDRFQAEAYPDVEIALDIAVLKNLALWQEALVAEKHAFELYLQPDIPDEVERLGLLGPSAAATEAQDQFVNLTPAGRRAIADRLAGNSAALVLARARGITRSDSVEARSSLQMSNVTAAADDLLSAIAAEHRTLEGRAVEATNNHLAEARAQQRMVLLGGAGSLLVLATMTLLLSRSIIREVKWLELRSREPHPRMFPSATSHGAMPIESSEPDIESRSMVPAQAAAVSTALAGAADRSDQAVADEAIVSAELSALDSIPESLRAPVRRAQVIDAMPVLSTAVPASSEVGSFDPAVAPSVPDDLTVSEDFEEPASGSAMAEDLAVSEDLDEAEDFAMSDAFSVPERLRRQLAGSSSHEIEPLLARVTADQFAAEFSAASINAPVLPGTVAFVGALPHRHTSAQGGVVLPEVEALVVWSPPSQESVVLPEPEPEPEPEAETEVEVPVEMPTPPSGDDPEVSEDEMNQAPATQETVASAILTIGAAFAAYELRSKPYDQEAFLDDDEFERLSNLGR